jgi:hypothetical protein
MCCWHTGEARNTALCAAPLWCGVVCCAATMAKRIAPRAQSPAHLLLLLPVCLAFLLEVLQHLTLLFTLNSTQGISLSLQHPEQGQHSRAAFQSQAGVHACVLRSHEGGAHGCYWQPAA